MAEYYEHIYPYQPSLALALSAAGFFGILAFLHTYQALRSNAWFFIAFVIGGYCKSNPRPADVVAIADEIESIALDTSSAPSPFSSARNTHCRRTQNLWS